jgi:Tfp pilus assembly protein FimV
VIDGHGRSKGEKMKNLTALITAFIVTALIGIILFGIGFNAMINKNTAPIVDTPPANNTVQVSNQVQVKQLENSITQYQSQLNQAIEQLNAQNAQIQQYQSLLQALVARGVIAIQQDGTITIPRR